MSHGVATGVVGSITGARMDTKRGDNSFFDQKGQMFSSDGKK